MSDSVPKTIVALGANLSLGRTEPHLTLRQALTALSEKGLVIRDVSRFFSTPCFPAGAGPDYVNAAASIETTKAPEELLQDLHAVEHEFGRERAQRWGMRTLDLDLICYADQVLPDRATFDLWRDLDPDLQAQSAPDELILPHPRLQDRAFVLVPMADIAPEWRHPVLNKTVTQMMAALSTADVAEVTPL
ncbi:MAG: 2-amino-4-hydroxy-6-hydroxymethyldihydropteridine diphosphokinase [Pseudomonadota bacterium]